MNETERGRRLLRELLPWAKAEANKGGGLHIPRSPLGRTTTAYVTHDNMDALMIYQAPLGGWHADVVLKRMPQGVPNVIGTPAGQPKRTRLEAEETGKELLVMLCAIANQNAASTEAKPEPVFLLHGVAIRLSSQVYDIASTLMPEGAGGPNGGWDTKEIAISRIEGIVAELFPKGFSLAAANALSLQGKAELMTVLSIAALTGVFAYPPRTDATPSGHRETSTARH